MRIFSGSSACCWAPSTPMLGTALVPSGLFQGAAVLMLSVWSGEATGRAGWCGPGSLFPQRLFGAPVLGGVGGLCLRGRSAGRLSPYLLQPLHPLWRYVAAHLGEQLPSALCGPDCSRVLCRAGPGVLAASGRFLLAWLATWSSLAIAFLFQSLIAALCFWSEKASALERLQFIPLCFSGLLAPLTAFPPAVRAWARWTPFPYLIDFPARVLAQQPVGLIAGFGARLAWIAVLPLVLLLWQGVVATAPWGLMVIGRYWRILRRFWGTAVAAGSGQCVDQLLAVAVSLSGSLFLLSLLFGPDRTLELDLGPGLMVQGFTVFVGWPAPGCDQPRGDRRHVREHPGFRAQTDRQSVLVVAACRRRVCGDRPGAGLLAGRPSGRGGAQHPPFAMLVMLLVGGSSRCCGF